MSETRLQQLRAAAGEAGWTVYDRQDRMENEHRACNWRYEPDQFDDGMQIRIIHCDEHGAMLIFRVM